MKVHLSSSGSPHFTPRLQRGRYDVVDNSAVSPPQVSAELAVCCWNPIPWCCMALVTVHSDSVRLPHLSKSYRPRAFFTFFWLTAPSCEPNEPCTAEQHHQHSLCTLTSRKTVLTPIDPALSFGLHNHVFRFQGMVVLDDPSAPSLYCTVSQFWMKSEDRII